jgi:enolase
MEYNFPMSNPITSVTAAVVLNSRSASTIAVTVQAGDFLGTFSVPEGASTGSKEVKVFAPDDALRIMTQVVQPALVGKDVEDQGGIDSLLHELDGSDSFENIGGNVALGVSIACCKAAAQAQGREPWEYIKEIAQLAPQRTAPHLFVNLINGGKHAAQGSPIQEHQIIPDTADVALAYESALSVQKELLEILHREYGAENIGKGDEGGFAVSVSSVFSPFDHLHEAIENADTGVKIYIGADIAASSFYADGAYMLDGDLKDAAALSDFYDELHLRAPMLAMVEDPYFETDLEAYAGYRTQHPHILVIGDDLTTTNARELQKAIDAQAINGIIIKPNQIGTVSDTLATMRLAYANNVQCIVSHRSGETDDDFIADLAFGTGSFGLKAGAPLSKERDSKYKRLIHIQKTFNA